MTAVLQLSAAQQTPSVNKEMIVNSPPIIIPDIWPDSMEEYKIKLPSPTLTNFKAVQPLLSLYIKFIVIYFFIQLQSWYDYFVMIVTIVTKRKEAVKKDQEFKIAGKSERR